jgi:lipopolysaccharide transport system ATP-binding protein
MAAVTRLCDRGLLLRNGRLILEGSAADVVHSHVTGGSEDISGREWSLEDAPGDDSVRLRSIKLVSQGGSSSSSVSLDERFGVQMMFDVLEPDQVLNPYFTVVSETGIDLFTTMDRDSRHEIEARKPGRYIMTAWVPGGLLAEGTHYVRVVMRSVKRKYRPFTERDVIAFNMVDRSGTAIAAGWWEGRTGGVFRPNLDWTTEYVQPEMIIEG